MAAIVSGNSLGLLNSSLYVLGSQGALGQAAQGRAGEQVYINADTGNLVIQNRDELLVGRGPDLSLLRTYNSQGLLDDDNADNWRLGVYRKVTKLTGTVNTSWSTVTRVAEDGSESVYSYDSTLTRYVCHDGGGAYDQLAFASATQTWTWSWTDGTTQLTELYDAANGGRITQMLDQDGNGLIFTYNAAGLITQVTDASGETTFLDYTGDNLTQLRTVTSGGQTLIRTRYGYDTSNRLTQITTDLSPDDASVTDGNVYVVNYTYDGASRRVATLTQSDGNNLTFAYVQVGTAWKLQSYTDAAGKITRLDYTQSTGSVPASATANNAVLSTTETQTTTTTVAPYYTVASGDTWTSITQTVYGTSDANAVAALQSALGNPALTAGTRLTVPQTLSYNATTSSAADGAVLSTTITTTTTVAPYYTVQSGDTWTSITQTVYGTSDANAVAALQTALGNPALTTGAQLTVPQTLGYAGAGTTVNANSAVLATSGWSGASLLETSATAASLPRVGFDGAGNAIAVWVQGSDLVASRYTQTADTWSAPTVLDNRTNAISAPQLYVDASGNAIATWVQSDGTAASTYVNRYVSGVWQGTELVETATVAIAEPAASINANGQAAVVWRQTNGTIQDLYANRYSGGVWSGAQLIETGTTTVATPGVAIDAQGNIQAIWQQSDGTANSIYSNRYAVGAGWSGASLRESSSTAASLPSIGSDGAGNFIAVWLQGSDVLASRYVAASGTWSAAAVLDNRTNAISAPQLYVDASGNAIATWVQSDGTAASTYVNRYVSGVWQGTELVETASAVVAEPKAAINAAGQAVVVWRQTGTVQDLYANRYSGGVWSGAQLIEAGTAAVATPGVAIDAQGNIQAIWQQSDGTANSIYTNRYVADTAPYYTVQASDTWSSIAQTVYGDTAAAGPLQAALGNPALTAGLRLTVPSSLTYSSVTAPLNAAAVSTTQATTTSTTYSLNSGLVNLAAGWGSPTALETSAAAASQLLMGASNYGRAVSAWLQGGSLYASAYDPGAHVWTAPILVSGALTNISAPQLDVDQELGNAVITWVDATTGRVYANRGVRNGSSVDWQGAQLVATASGTLAEAAGTINLYGTSAVLWREVSGGTQSLMVSRWNGTAWGAAEQVASGTAAITAPQIAATTEDVIQVVWRASDGTAESLFTRGYNPVTVDWGSTVSLENSSVPVSLFRIDSDIYADVNVTWVQGNDIYINWGGEGQSWNGALLQASSPSPISQYAYSDSAGSNVVAWLAGDGNLYAYRWGATAAELVAAGPGLTEVSADANSLGETIVSWRSGNDLYASRYVDGAWSAAQPLESSNAAASTPRVAVDENGETFAVWQQSDGVANSIFASRFPTGGNTLQNWVPVDNLSGATGSWTDYTIDVPAGQSELFAGLAGGSAGDADIFVRYGALPSQTEFDAKSDGGTNDEGVLIQNPAAGTWYVSVHASTAFDAVQLQAHYQSGTGGTTVLQPGQAVSDLYGISGSQRAFSFDIPAGTTDFKLALTGSNGQDADLYLRFGTPPTDAVFDFSAEGSTVNDSITVSAPQAGAWFALVEGFSPFYADAALVLNTNLGGNTPPTVQGGAPQLAAPGAAVTLAATGGDAQGAVTYQWTQIAGPAVTISNATSATATFTAPSVSSPTLLDFRVRVTDSQGATNTDIVHVLVSAPSQGYVVQSGDTWSSIATALYGSAGVADELQAALGNPALTVGSLLAGFPGTLTDTVTTTITVPPYYTVQAGDTWATITQAVYGTIEANAQLALLDALGDPALTAGATLTVPSSIRYAGAAGTGSTTASANNAVLSTTITTTTTVAPYYTVGSTDTWSSITQTVYGTSNANAVAALQAALGNPALSAGLHLTVPATISYTTSVSSTADAAVLSTTIMTTTTVTVAPYYTVQAGDTWSSIAQTVYGDAQAGSALQTAMGNPALTAGAHLTVPQTLDYTKTVVSELRTDITDPLGLVTTMVTDAQGQLTQILAPAVGGVRQSASFTYNANGDVTQVTDAKGLATSYGYGANGNRVLERDAAGNTITRFFGTKNELLAETSYVVPDPDGAGPAQPGSPLTTRYAYDTSGHLRFAVSGEGRVTEYRYNTFGQRTASIQYNSSLYDLTGLTPTSPPLTEAQLMTFVGAADKTKTVRVDSTYDFRGQLSTTTSYGRVDTAGNGVADADQTLTSYIYDQAGILLYTVDARGKSTVYVHDGLGRLTTTTDATGQLTLTQYDDANRKTVLTSANGLVTTSTYDARGELVSVMQSAGAQALGTTSYFYDADGRLRRTVDPSGIATHILYDEADRKIASIDGTGSLTEYRYDADNNLTRSIRYATVLTLAQLASLSDVQGNPTGVTLDTSPSGPGIRPAASGQDRSTWNTYDSANRLLKSVDELGFVTQRFYDGAGRLTDVLEFSSPISAASLADAPTPSSINPASNTLDRLTRNFYDADGELRGTLDGEGFLVEYKYDAAGQLTETVSYATATNAGLRTTGTMAQLIPAASANDIHTYRLYNAKGQAVGEVDGESYLTEYVYDANGNKTQVIRYATRANFTPGASIAAIRPQAPSPDRLNLPGTPGSNASTPDTAANSITGDIDIRVKVTLDDWTPGAAGNIESLFAKMGANDQRAWLFAVQYDGTLLVDVSPNGANERFHNSSVATGFADGSTHWVRATLDVDNGSGSSEARFYTSDDYDPTTGSGTWTQLGIPVLRNGATSIFDSSASLEVGSAFGGTSLLAHGKVYYADVRNGINGAVAARFNPSADAGSSSATSFTSSTGELWTLGGGATLSSSGAQDEVSSYTYTALNQLATETNALGTRTQYFYDSVGNLIQTVIAQNTGDARTLNARYDAQGRLTAELSGNASALLTPGLTQPQIDAIWAANATKYSYDADGRRTSTTDRNGNKTLFYYDADGHLTHTIDAPGEVTENQYNALGQVFKKINYGTRLTSATLSGLNGGLVDATLTSALGAIANPALDSTTTYAYTLRGQLASATDALNASTTNYSYDKDGNAVAKTEAVGKPEVRNTRYVYDGNGRLVYAVDASAGVTKNEYDVQGRVTRTIAYTTTLSEFASLPAVPTAGDVTSRLTVSPNDQMLTHVYDRDGREVYTVDALGEVTQRIYDAAGKVVERISYATTIPPSTPATPTAVGAALASDPAHDNNVRLVYDTANRLVYAIDGLGDVTRNDYDARDNVVRTTTYASALTAAQLAGLGPNPSVASVQSLVVANAALDQVEQRVFDADNRLVYKIDALGFVQKNDYDALGNITRTTRYAQAISVSTPATVAAVSAAIVSDPTLDSNVRLIYDAANRLVYTIDGLGDVTRNDYDAHGNVVRVTTYAAALTAARLGALGSNPTVSGVQSQVVANAALDHMTQRVFDADNQLVYKIDALGFVEKTDYDALGQVIRTARYAQAIPLSTPATLAAVAAALIANANRVDVRALNLPGTNGSYASTPASAANSITGDLDVRVEAAATDWTPTTDYMHLIGKWDGAGGAGVSWYLAVRSSGSLYLQWMEGGITRNALSTIPSGLADGAKKWVRATLDVDNGAGGNEVRFYTSDDGVAWTQLGATVTGTGITSIADSAGAVTVGTRDHGIAGLFAGKIYYADARNGIDGTVAVKFNPADAGDSNAQSFVSTTGETWALAGSATLDSPSLTVNQADTFAYDAAGHLVYHVDGHGEVTRNDYDAAGDVTRTTGYATLVGISSLGITPTLASVQSQVTVQPTLDHVEQRVLDAAGRLIFSIDAAGYVTQRSYDGNGNVTQEVRYAKALQTFTPGVAPQVATDPLDQVTRTVYDAANRSVFLIDAAGFVTQRFYDAKGNLVKEVRYANPLQGAFTFGSAPQIVTSAPASGSYVIVDASRDRTTRRLYDADGRMRYSVDPMGYVTERHLDGFGQEIQRIRYADPATVPDEATVASVALLLPATLPANAVLEEAHYDAAGRVLDSIDGKGVLTRLTYDAFGNPTDKIEALGLPEERRTHTVYDALGRLVEQTTAFGTADASTKRFRFDAFGNQIAYVDPRGVDLAERDTAWASAERLRLGYVIGTRAKLAGELTAGEKANLLVLYTTVQTFDGVNRKLSATDPLGNTTRSDYDAFGNIVRAIDPNGNAGYLYYDLRNLLVAQIDPEGDLTEYGYDAAGNKTQTIRYATSVSVPYDPWRPLALLRPKGLSLPGSVAYASTPDSAASSVTGDIEITVKLALDNWAPGAGIVQTAIAKWNNNTQCSYWVRIEADGKMSLFWSADGAGGFYTTSTAAIGGTNGAALYLKVTLDVNDGAGGHAVKFWTSGNGVAWTQLGSTVTGAGTTSIFDGTSTLEIGKIGGTSGQGFFMAGKVYYAEVRNGIGGAVAAKFDPSADASAGATSFVSSTGETWSISGTATFTTGSPQDEITTTTYDTLGRVTQIVDAEGHTELFAYDRNSKNVSSHQDKNGNVTRYEYDADGNKTAEHLPVTSSLPNSQTWQGAQSIETTGNFVFQPQIVADAQGNAFAIWLQADVGGTNLYVNRYLAVTGTWQGAQLIGTGSSGIDPQIAVDVHGDAIAVWEQNDGIYANRYLAATGVWQGAQRITTATGAKPQIAFDSQGNAIAVWQQATGFRTDIYANRYVVATGTWQGAQLIESNDTASAVLPQIAFDSVGNAIAVWEQGGIYANRYVAATGTWQGAQALGVGSQPRIALDPQGNAIVVWEQSDGTRFNIWANRYAAATGTWQGAQLIETNDSGNALSPQIALDAQGNAIAVWQHFDGTRYGIYANRYAVATGTWQGAQLIETDDRGSAQSPKAAFDAQGNATVVWSQFDGTRGSIYANRYMAAAGAWQGVQLLETNDARDAFSAQIAVSAQGTAFAEWDQSSDIFVNRYDFTRVPVVNRYEYDALRNKTKDILAQGLPEERVTQYVYDKNNRLIETIESQLLTQQSSAPAATGSLQLGAGGTANFTFTQTIVFIQQQLYGSDAHVDVSWPPIIGYGDSNVKVVWKTGTSLGDVTATTGPQATSVTITAFHQVASAPIGIPWGAPFEIAIYKQTSSGDVLITRTAGAYSWSSGSQGTFSASSQVLNVLHFTGQPAGQTMHVVYWPSSDPNDITEIDLKSYATGTFSGMTPSVLSGSYNYEANVFDANGDALSSFAGTFSMVNGASTATTQAQSFLSSGGALQTPHVFRAYDAAGNLVRETDAKGNITYDYYDANNRLIGTVSAERILRRYFYDGAGNLVAQRTYGDRIPDAVALDALPDPAVIAGMDPANFREADYRYSANNLQTETDTQSVLVYDRTNGLRTQVLASARQYDRNGNLILEIDANGNKTYSYYDKADRRIAQVDASNYLTTWVYDPMGNVVRKTRYATALQAQTVSTSSNPLALAAAVANNPDDRICLYAYDRMNRLIQETTLGVDVTSVVTNTGSPSFGAATEQLANVVVRQRYDNMGNLAARIQDTAETDFLYDGLNRLVQKTDPSFADFFGATVRGIRTLVYDGVGNVKQLNQNGSITSYEYDPHGHLTREIDPLGNPTRYYYDLNGNVTVKHTRHVNPDGTAPGVDAVYTYDKLNRQTSTNERRNFTSYVRYDAYGEIVEKGLNNLSQEYEEYDKAGRLIKTNKDDGVDRVYLYDANGNETAKIQSAIQDTDLRAPTIDEIAALSAAVVQRTESAYDAKNQLIGTYQTLTDLRTDSAGAPQIWVDALGDPFTGGTMAIGGGTDADFSFSYNPVAAWPFNVFVSLGVNLPPIVGYGDGNVKIVWRNGTETAQTVVPSGEHSGHLNISAPASTTYQIEIYKETTSGDALVMSTSGTYAWEQGPFFLQYYSSAPLPRQLHLYGYSPDVQDLDFRIWQTGTSKPTSPAPVSRLVAGGTPVAGHFVFDWSGLSGDYDYEIVPLDAQGLATTAPVKGSVRLTGWGDPQQVSVAAPDNTGAQIASDPNGNAMAVWQQSDGVRANIWAARYIAGSGWQPARIIGSNNGGDASSPQVAFGPNGNAMAVWQQYDGVRTNIWAAAYVAGSWQPAQMIENDNAGGVANPQVAFDPNGNAIAVWEQSDGLRTNIWTNRYVAGAGWGAPALLETDNAGSARNAQIAVDHDGNAFAVWQQSDGSRENIWANRYVAGSGWEGARLIENNNDALMPGGTGAIDPQVATDGQGNAIVTWRHANSYDVNGNLYYGIWANRYVRSVGAWEGEQNIIGGGTTDRPKLAIDMNGDAMVITSGPPAMGVTGAEARRYVAGRGWATLTYQNSTGGTTVAADVTMLETDAIGLSRDTQITSLGNGAFVAAWVRDEGAQTTAWTARYDPSTGWSTPERLGNGTLNKYAPKAVAGADGRVIALWLQSDAAFYASVFQPPAVASKLVGGYNASNEIVRSQSYNAFGQVVREIDARGNATDLSYNTRGGLIQKADPATNATEKTGAVIAGFRPTTRYYYDYLGRSVGTQDAAGNQSTRSYDAAGHLLFEMNPNAINLGFKQYAYDVAGNRVFAANELGISDRYAYDAKNQLIRIDHPTRPEFGNVPRFDLIDYDEEGRRIRHTNALGFSDLTFFDSTGRVTRTTNAAGVTTQYRYTFDPTSKGSKSITLEQTAQGQKSLQDTKDYFGRLLQHVDLGGHRFAYTYNKAGWLIQQSGDTNLAVPGNEQDIAYTYYQNGYLKEVIDKRINAFSKYEYDLNGNRTFEGYAQTTSSGLAYYESSKVQYDALNRVTRIDDPKYSIKYEYDRNGNRRHVLADYHDGLNGTPQKQDYWYDYDAMDRFTVTQGSLLDASGIPITAEDPASRPIGTIGIGATGTQIDYYNDSRRKTATYHSGSQTVKDSYTYVDGLLTGTTIVDLATGSQIGSATRTYDAVGEVKTYAESGVAGSRSSSYTYRPDGKVSREISSTTGTTNYFYDDAGTLLKGLTAQSGGTTLATLYAYEYWDAAKQSKIQVQASNAAAPGWQPGFSNFIYDVNGHLTQVNDIAGNRSLRYALDAHGLVLRRNELTGSQSSKTQYYYYLNGVGVGDSGFVASRTDYASVLASRGTNPKTAEPISSADFGSNYMPINDRYPDATPGTYTIQDGEIGDSYDQTLRNVALAVWGDATLWYILADANGLAPGSPNLVAGQTLVVPNVVTNIHNNSGTFKVYDAGEAIGDTTPTLPEPPRPPVQNPDGCGVWGMAIVVVVIIVVTIYTAGATSEFLVAEGAAEGTAGAGAAGAGATGAGAAGAGATGAGAAGASSTWQAGLTALSGQGGWAGFAGAVVGGAAGSIAGQLTAMGLGMQEHFSWKQVGMAAVGAGVTAGIGAYAGQAGLASKLGLVGYLGQDASLAFNAVVANLATQGIGKATGWQETFSWKSAAVSALAAPVASRAADAVQGEVGYDDLGNSFRTGTAYSRWTGDFGAQLTTSFVSGAATQAVRRRVYGNGEIDYGQIAADSFGNVVGHSLTEDLARVEGRQETTLDREDAELGAAMRASRQASVLGNWDREDAELGAAMTTAGTKSSQGAPTNDFARSIAKHFGLDPKDVGYDDDMSGGLIPAYTSGKYGYPRVHQNGSIDVIRSMVGTPDLDKLPTSVVEFSNAVADIQEYIDDIQHPTAQHMHALSNREDYSNDRANNLPLGTTARQKANDFVRTMFDAAWKLSDVGDYDGAYKYVGIAIHTLQDSTSPVHAFGLYDPPTSLYGYYSYNKDHADHEDFYPGLRSNFADATRDAIKWFINGLGQGGKRDLPQGNLFKYGIDRRPGTAA